MHGRGLHQGKADRTRPAIWLLSGTGEGPVLAEELLQRGWRVVVSVVSAEAARAYRARPGLVVQVGPLGEDAAAAVLAELQPRWVVDATHPFALQISGLLQRVCALHSQPLLALARAEGSPPGAPGHRPPHAMTMLADLNDLSRVDLRGRRLLLAIGSRQLRAALAASNAAAHFARVLDRPVSLQQALASGLPDRHLACLRPDPAGSGLLERALCRRWHIDAVLCRQSGGAGEAFWHRLCGELGLELLLLLRPAPPAGPLPERLPLVALLEKLGRP